MMQNVTKVQTILNRPTEGTCGALHFEPCHPPAIEQDVLQPLPELTFILI
jgi:hypothetical protein